MKVLTGKLLLAMLGCTWLTGCASIGAPQPPSLELPKAPSDLRATRKGNRVTLTWTIPKRTTDRQSVRFLGKTLVCRNLETQVKECGHPVGEVAPPAEFTSAQKSSALKVASSFVDVIPPAAGQSHPEGYASYAVEVLNSAGHGAGISNPAHVPLLPALPPLNEFAAQAVDEGIAITWKCSKAVSAGTPNTKYLFRIYRKPDAAVSATKIAEVDVPSCAAGGNISSTSYLDQSFEWEKTYLYRGTVVSVLGNAGKPDVEVEGDDTPEVRVFAHDIFPPAVPGGLQAVFSGPGQQAFIDLIWTPVTNADLDGYNVFRHEVGTELKKINVELVKTPAYRDTHVEPGKTYFYSVSAVDQRGNQSGRSEEGSERVPEFRSGDRPVTTIFAGKILGARTPVVIR